MRRTRSASPGPTSSGVRGSWTAATDRRAGAEAAAVPPRDPECPRWGRAGREAGGLPQASAARREGSRGPGSPLSTRPPPPPPFCLPLGVAAAALRCRFPGCWHFPASLARGPRTGGFCPPGRLQRAPPAARSLPPAAFSARSLARAVSPAPNAAQGTRPCSWDQALARRSPRIYYGLFFQLSSFNGKYRYKDAHLKELNSQKETAMSCSPKPRCGHQDSGFLAALK